MGDKTQIATVALAARYHDLMSVVAGTTLGMLLADVPAVDPVQLCRRPSRQPLAGVDFDRRC